MAIFYGTPEDDKILSDFLSAGVTSDPEGLGGTGDEPGSEIYGFDGNDLLESGGGAFEFLYGGNGQDTLLGGASIDVLDGGAGADVMMGGDGQDFYIVDSLQDKILETGTTEADLYDEVVTDINNYKLPDGIENLTMSGSFFDIYGSSKIASGNDLNNIINGNFNDNLLRGEGGDDWLRGFGGNNTLIGGSGDDQLDGSEFEVGDDVLRGQNGNDILWGKGGADILIGGDGDDSFFYNGETAIIAGPAVIRAGDGAVAFEGVGIPGGDHIDIFIGDVLPEPGYQPLVFGGIGQGQVSVVDSGKDSLVQVNADASSEFEITILIEDGPQVTAAMYTADDFMFG